MITIVNVSENNLKNISLNIPSNKFIVVTGVSGSGKSTLVYDVIYKEARRRYLETFSTNARQFMGKLNRPNVQFMSGLLPPVALKQNSVVQSPRSTVGTLTELYDLLRLLFARSGTNFDGEKLSRSHFSFNTHKGACTHCKGLGVEDFIGPDLLIADANKTIRNGAFTMTTPSGYIVYSQVTMDVLNQICQAEGFSVDMEWGKLNAKQKNIILFGSKKLKVPFGKHTLESRMKWSGITAKPREEGYYKGIIPVMDEILKRDRNPNVLRFARTKTCTACKGSRLNALALETTFHGKNIAELAAISISKLIAFFEQVQKIEQSTAAQKISNQILQTALLVEKLGLGYLSLNQAAESLSGGETQRLRLAKLVSTKMRGILYVFDEPSVGLHTSETQNLLEVLYQLKNNGNTVIAVEHNHQVIKNAEWIIDLGPGAGTNGGQILFNGKVPDFLKLEKKQESKTLSHLIENVGFKSPANSNKYLELKKIATKQLNNINVQFRINALNVVTGLSGSGKRALVNYTLAQYFLKKLNGSKAESGSLQSIINDDLIEDLVVIDQKPIGKTPRSNAATYTGLSDEIRNLFANLPEAQQSGFTRKHFSFNTKGGRCEKCEGAGYEQMGMHLLGNIEVLCPKCEGKQFKPEVLSIQYNGKSISDIYKLTIEEATAFFTDQPKIHKYLKALMQVGLGYLKLNQRSSTLSGGEARRIKLAKSLAKIANKPTLYIIDEPSSGLHSHDIYTLLSNINQLITNGHTVVLIEQNPIFIKNADHLIELSVKNHNKADVIFQGSPQEILSVEESLSAKALNNGYSENLKFESNVFDIFNPIELKGVETNNLKQINVNIPFNKITTITGLSGSGKSSLAFDTLFAKGRQSYAESFSSYVRTRLNINSNAKFESIKGLMPTIAVNQQSVSQSERSTVGTMTDIYDHLRLLYSRVGIFDAKNEKLSASHFSFNHEHGACKCCEGLGYEIKADTEKLISMPNLSLFEGAMQGSKPGKFYGDLHGQYLATLNAVGEKQNIDFKKPWNQLSKNEQHIAMHGTGEEKYSVSWQFKRNKREGKHEFESTWPGFLHYINEEYLRKANDKRKDALLPIMAKVKCPVCNGSRLNKDALSYQVLGLNIHQMCNIEVGTLLQEFRKQVVVPNAFSTNAIEQKAAQIIAGSIINGLDILDKLGLGYLTLSRQAPTLSGGEGQRVRLAAGLAQDISGVCFVLDEPTTGMHPKDLDNLYFMLHELKRQGNTIVVCEHDPGFIRYSDHVIELGPKAGANGGNIVFEGEVKDLLKSTTSITAQYLNPDYTFARKKNLNVSNDKIVIEGAYANNLKNISLEIPTNKMVVVKGVSGSGKSSLVKKVIYESYLNNKAQYCKSISGLENFDKIVFADQKIPTGSALSFVATYLDFYKSIKSIFAEAARFSKAEITASSFTLSGKHGKCPVCQGKGFIKNSLDFMSDVIETCEECKGKRFDNEVLNITVEGKSIADVLNMPIEKLVDFLPDKHIIEYGQLLIKLGLGYLSAGQTLSTLSGGELQRLKLAKALTEKTDKPVLFLLDEPTTGLHMHDVEQLMHAFDELLEQGNSLIIIEHHKTVIDSADHHIEFGPGAGEKGGYLV